MFGLSLLNKFVLKFARLAFSIHHQCCGPFRLRLLTFFSPWWSSSRLGQVFYLLRFSHQIFLLWQHRNYYWGKSFTAIFNSDLQTFTSEDVSFLKSISINNPWRLIIVWLTCRHVVCGDNRDKKHLDVPGYVSNNI